MPAAVTIAIPARDEKRGVAATLRALAAQRSTSQLELPPFAVMVLANNCRDQTAEVARTVASTAMSGIPTKVLEVQLPPAQANVVGARRAAFEAALQLGGPQSVLVSTDADTQAHPEWLAHLLAPLLSGQSEVSAGRILLRPTELRRLAPKVRATYLLDTNYRLAAAQLRAKLLPEPHDPAPNHWQHFGANMAFTAQAYRRSGGIPQVSELEDVALINALQRTGSRVRHTPDARVYTSARLSGRVPVGLSTQLREWQRGPECWTVPGGPELYELGQAEAALRDTWNGGPRPELAKLWRVTAPELDRALRSEHWGEALAEAHLARQRREDWKSTFRPVPVAQALQEIRQLLRPHQALDQVEETKRAQWDGAGMALCLLE